MCSLIDKLTLACGAASPPTAEYGIIALIVAAALFFILRPN